VAKTTEEVITKEEETTTIIRTTEDTITIVVIITKEVSTRGQGATIVALIEVTSITDIKTIVATISNSNNSLLHRVVETHRPWEICLTTMKT